MIRSVKYACLLFICLTFQARAQSTHADSVKAELQGAWRMDDDTNVVLIFYGDSMIHRMMRTSGSGRVRFKVSDKSCDTTRYNKKNGWYLEETFRYYRNNIPLEDKLCNKIAYLKNGILILKRNDIYEDYTKMRSIPPKK